MVCVIIFLFAQEFPGIPDICEYSWIILFIFEKKKFEYQNIFESIFIIFIFNIMANTIYSTKFVLTTLLLYSNGLRKLDSV